MALANKLFFHFTIYHKKTTFKTIHEGLLHRIFCIVSLNKNSFLAIICDLFNFFKLLFINGTQNYPGSIESSMQHKVKNT